MGRGCTPDHLRLKVPRSAQIFSWGVLQTNSDSKCQDLPKFLVGGGGCSRSTQIQSAKICPNFHWGGGWGGGIPDQHSWNISVEGALNEFWTIISGTGQSYYKIFFYHFPNIPCLKDTVNSNFHLIRSKTLPTNDFKLCSHLTFAFAFASASSLTSHQWKHANTNTQKRSECLKVWKVLMFYIDVMLNLMVTLTQTQTSSVNTALRFPTCNWNVLVHHR